MNRTDRKAQLVESKGGKCHDCGHAFPLCCFDFDHREPELKSFCISLKLNERVPLDELIAEADKCDLVCANCHRIRTHTNPKLKAMRRKNNIGRKMSPRSEEWKRKQRDAQLGMKKPAIARALQGVPWTEERKAAKRGTPWTSAQRASYEERFPKERTANV